MAKNDDTNRTHQTNRRHSGDRERRRDMVVNTVKERPYTAAALATVAAGAAAFFLTRGKGDKPLMNWGQESSGDAVKGAGAFKGGASATDRSLEAADHTTSSTGTQSATPSAVQAAGLASSGTNAAVSTGTGTPGSTAASPSAQTGKPNAGTGLDQSAKTDTKVGAISYGA